MAPPPPSKRSAGAKRSQSTKQNESVDDMDFDTVGDDVEVEAEGSSSDEASESIPGNLLVRLLHTFFEQDGSRISRDANSAVAKYMDVFVKEAIARTAHEKSGSFLEVSDLEKVAPQLLLDL